MVPGHVPADSPGALLHAIRAGQANSRSELARLTRVSASTAALRVQSLIDLGFVHEAGPGQSQGGRRPRRLELRTEVGVVAAADLGSHHASLALFDLGGTLLRERHRSMQIADGPRAVLGWVHAQITEMLAELGEQQPPLHGLAIGVPGPVDSRLGRVVSPSRMPGWNGADVPALLADLTDVPVLVDNDANLMALGEYAADKDSSEHLVFVKAGTGIGCGVIASGQLHRGNHGAAGDISHVAVAWKRDVPCSCGRVGCLDAVASGAALTRDLAAAGLPVTDTADVVALSREADPVSARMLRDAGRASGEVLATIVNFFNPDSLVLGGQLSQAETYVASLRSTLYERCLPMATENLKITLSGTGPLAGVIGGAQLMLEHIFEPSRVNQLVDASSAESRTSTA